MSHVLALEPGQNRYAALAQALHARILAGEWPPGAALPAEDVLARAYGVALATLRRALELLASRGLVERVHGRGTFVRESLSGATMLRFFRFGSGTGEVPASRVVSRRRLPASAEVAARLGIGPGEPVLRIQRLRSLGDVPCLLEDIHLPLPLFEPLAEGDASGWDDLFYPMYARRCGVHVHRASDDIGFGTCGAAQGQLLGLPAGHPCAKVQRQAFDLAGRCVEVRTSLGDAHAFHYTVTIT